MPIQLNRRRQAWELYKPKTLLSAMIETKKIFRPYHKLLMSAILIRVQLRHLPFRMKVNTPMSLEMMSARKKWWIFARLSTRSRLLWSVDMARMSLTKDLLSFKKTNRLSCQKLMESSRSLNSSTLYSTAQMTAVDSSTTAQRIFFRKT